MEENLEIVEEMILSRTPAEIAAVLWIHRRQVQQMIDEDLDLKPLRKTKVQSLSDADIEKRRTRGKNLIKRHMRKVLSTAFFSDEKQNGFPQKMMMSVAVSKAGKTTLFFVDPGTKVNAYYYANVLMKKRIPQMNRLAKGEEYLFMQDGLFPMGVF